MKKIKCVSRILAFYYFALLAGNSYATPEDLERCKKHTGDENSVHIATILIEDNSFPELLTLCSSTLGNAYGSLFDWVFLRCTPEHPEVIIKKYIHHDGQTLLNDTDGVIFGTQIATTDSNIAKSLEDYLSMTSSGPSNLDSVFESRLDEHKHDNEVVHGISYPDQMTEYTFSYIDNNKKLRVKTVSSATFNPVITQNFGVM